MRTVMRQRARWEWRHVRLMKSAMRRPHQERKSPLKRPPGPPPTMTSGPRSAPYGPGGLLRTGPDDAHEHDEKHEGGSTWQGRRSTKGRREKEHHHHDDARQREAQQFSGQRWPAGVERMKQSAPRTTAIRARQTAHWTPLCGRHSCQNRGPWGAPTEEKFSSPPGLALLGPGEGSCLLSAQQQPPPAREDPPRR